MEGPWTLRGTPRYWAWRGNSSSWSWESVSPSGRGRPVPRPRLSPLSVALPLTGGTIRPGWLILFSIPSHHVPSFPTTPAPLPAPWLNRSSRRPLCRSDLPSTCQETSRRLEGVLQITQQSQEQPLAPPQSPVTQNSYASSPCLPSPSALHHLFGKDSRPSSSCLVSPSIQPRSIRS